MICARFARTRYDMNSFTPRRAYRIPKEYIAPQGISRILSGIHIASRQSNDCLHMPRDNSVNKIAAIYAAHTTLGVGNMPLTGCVRAPGSVSLSRQTGICRYRLTTYSASASAISKCPGSCCVCSICPFFFLSVHSGASSRSPLVKNMYTSSPRKSQTA